MNEPYDDVYHRKTLVHELAHVVLDRLARARPEGWALQSAPQRFQEGYAEYLSLVRSSETTKQRTLPKYVASCAKNAQRIGPQFEIDRVYVDGAVLLLFLHERFDRETVQAVITSSATSFAAALTDETGLGLDALHAEFLRWLSKR